MRIRYKSVTYVWIEKQRYKKHIKGTHRVAYIRDKIREDMTEAGYKWEC